MKNCHKLQPIIDPLKFKEYDELNAKLCEVLELDPKWKEFHEQTGIVLRPGDTIPQALAKAGMAQQQTTPVISASPATSGAPIQGEAGGADMQEDHAAIFQKLADSN